MRDDKSFISQTILSTRTLFTRTLFTRTLSTRTLFTRQLNKNYPQKILDPMRTRVLPSAMAMG